MTDTYTCVYRICRKKFWEETLVSVFTCVYGRAETASMGQGRDQDFSLYIFNVVSIDKTYNYIRYSKRKKFPF